MIYLISKLISCFGVRFDWGSAKEAARQRSYYKRYER